MAEIHKLPSREEVDVRDTWALEDLYASDEEWEKEIAELEKSIERLAAYEGKLGESGAELCGFLKLEDELQCRVQRLLVYANEKMHQDMGVSKYQGYSTRVQTLYVRLDGAAAFSEPEFLKIPEERLAGFYEHEPELEHYRVKLDRILRQKEHILSDKEEAILSQTQELASAASDIRALFANADLKYGTVKDENGEEVELTNGNYVSFMQSSSRRVRRDAFLTMYRVCGQFRNSLAAMYQANVKQAAFYAEVRHYASAMEYALDGSRIPVSVYESLIGAVHAALPDMYRYVALRKRELGVDELHMYDVYVPLVSDYDMEVPFAEAKELVLKGLAPMGEEYLSHLREGFANRWIDVYENRGKRSGAYSWGAYGVHPYVLLNYQGKLDDVFTLAHEMGHALHSYYSNEAQSFTYAGYRIFVAEVASTCNEALLMRYLLEHCEDRQQKCYLLNHFLDQFKGTLFRQTMFAEFEMVTHRLYAEGEALTADRLCEIYLDLNKKYFGEEMVSDSQIALEWARIPHFYNEFYVYQYATGFAAAIALSNKILKEGASAVEAYKSFLKGGCSKDPLELLQLAGVDLSSPEPVKNALTLFGELVTELEELCRQEWKKPEDFPVKPEIPDVFSFMDGRKVENAMDWQLRRREIKSLYEYYMYGPLPNALETVSYELKNWREVDEEVKFFDGTAMWAKARACDIEVQVEYRGKSDRIFGIVTLPKEARQGGYPVYMEMALVFGGGEMKPSYNAYYAASRGYAAISFEPVRVAADNGTRSGAFYTVHPYGTEWRQQTGALAAWGWGASKLLDALENGAADELDIDWENNILSGVSRFGKAVLVAGAYDERIRVVVPACSGAGGAAMYRCNTEGNVYDLTELGFVGEDGTPKHPTTKNEPLESLQSTDERHWFNDRFLEFDTVERFPFDQHQLAALIANPKRYLFLIAAATNEDWTNPAAMHRTYAESVKVYDFLGLSDHIAIDIHLQGHAVLPSDMVKLLDYCDVMLYGKKPEDVQTELGELKRSEYFPLLGREG